jgi:hypothetical protein
MKTACSVPHRPSALPQALKAKINILATISSCPTCVAGLAYQDPAAMILIKGPSKADCGGVGEVPRPGGLPAAVQQVIRLRWSFRGYAVSYRGLATVADFWRVASRYCDARRQGVS